MLWPGENLRKSPCWYCRVKCSHMANWVTHKQSAAPRRRPRVPSTANLRSSKGWCSGCSMKPAATWLALHAKGLFLHFRKHLRMCGHFTRGHWGKLSMVLLLWKWLHSELPNISRSWRLEGWDFIKLLYTCLCSLTWLVAQHAKKMR